MCVCVSSADCVETWLRDRVAADPQPAPSVLWSVDALRTSSVIPKQCTPPSVKQLKLPLIKIWNMEFKYLSVYLELLQLTSI